MSYILQNPEIVGGLLLRHMEMTFFALLAGFAVALPLGSLVHRYQALSSPVFGILGVIYTIPSLALIILLLPWFGLGPVSVTIALFLYAQVILVRNVTAGLNAVNPALIEVAQSLGMNTLQRWWRIQLPLALPAILTGIRLAGVTAVGIAAIGAKFGAGGLGQLLFEGIAQTGRYDKIWAGSIGLAVLAITINQAFIVLEKKVTVYQMSSLS
jgi:osmoprotectant transport system permease protein